MDTRLIQELRRYTDCPITKCQEALALNSNDIPKALEWLRETMGLTMSYKKEEPIQKPESYSELKNEELLRLYTDSLELRLMPGLREYHEGYFVTSNEAIKLLKAEILRRMRQG